MLEINMKNEMKSVDKYEGGFPGKCMKTRWILFQK